MSSSSSHRPSRSGRPGPTPGAGRAAREGTPARSETTRQRRPSRTTVPIAPEDLQPLVAATSSHAIVAKATSASREEPAFQSAWASHAGQMKPTTPADAGASTSTAAHDPRESGREIADLTDDAVEEFTARGGSLHEVLASVTGDQRALSPLDWADSATPVARSRARPAAAPAPRPRPDPEGDQDDDTRSGRDTSRRIRVGGAASARPPAADPATSGKLGSSVGDASGAPAPRPEGSQRDQLKALLGRAAQLHQDGQPSQALALCQRALQLAPGHALASALAQRIELALVEQAEQRLGDLDAIPIVRVPSHEITWHALDHQTGFVLSRIDGLLSYNDILSISGMPRAATLRTLVRLLELKLIAAQH